MVNPTQSKESSSSHGPNSNQAESLNTHPKTETRHTVKPISMQDVEKSRILKTIVGVALITLGVLGLAVATAGLITTSILAAPLLPFVGLGASGLGVLSLSLVGGGSILIKLTFQQSISKEYLVKNGVEELHAEQLIDSSVKNEIKNSREGLQLFAELYTALPGDDRNKLVKKAKSEGSTKESLLIEFIGPALKITDERAVELFAELYMALPAANRSEFIQSVKTNLGAQDPNPSAVVGTAFWSILNKLDAGYYNPDPMNRPPILSIPPLFFQAVGTTLEYTRKVEDVLSEVKDVKTYIDEKREKYQYVSSFISDLNRNFNVNGAVIIGGFAADTDAGKHMKSLLEKEPFKKLSKENFEKIALVYTQGIFGSEMCKLMNHTGHNMAKGLEKSDCNLVVSSDRASLNIKTFFEAKGWVKNDSFAQIKLEITADNIFDKNSDIKFKFTIIPAPVIPAPVDDDDAQ